LSGAFGFGITCFPQEGRRDGRSYLIEQTVASEVFVLDSGGWFRGCPSIFGLTSLMAVRIDLACEGIASFWAAAGFAHVVGRRYEFSSRSQFWGRLLKAMESAVSVDQVITDAETTGRRLPSDLSLATELRHELGRSVLTATLQHAHKMMHRFPSRQAFAVSGVSRDY
jgi:hypothetical protein